ncbi:hypothetical protein EVAR_75204_1 [Eumeta japonica]|uniref:Endonuclease/exonuclease/phosphatase domain-containing protein n=1 Tax=Eumeta variegata TaxID=151549 RepID=A0A4C1U0P7_EUMVA|nr:hypothetical protein EVAR_75204_1 [Eumeta japonica]
MGKNSAQTLDVKFHPASVPSTNPWGENQPPRAVLEPLKEAIGRTPPALPPAFVITGPTTLFGKDIKIVMSILRTTKSSEISEFAHDLSLYRNAEDQLNVLVKYHLLMLRPRYTCHSFCLSPCHQKLLWSDLDALLALGDTVILFGDFNCKNPRSPSALIKDGPSYQREFQYIQKITSWNRVLTALKENDTLSK